MKQFNLYIANLLQESRYNFYLSFTRLVVCLLLIKKLLFQLSFVNLLYSGKSFLIPGNNIINEFMFSFKADIIRYNIYIYLSFYLVLILLYLFGIGRNITALIVFLMYDILQKLCPQILNGGDNLLRFILLYLIFANSFSYFVIEKRKSKKVNSITNFFSNLTGLSICIHLCLIYFISAIHKIHSDVWFNGVATYYTLNIERFNGSPFNHFVGKNYVFVTLSTYGTWFIELLYPILVWYRNWRYTMIIFAILLHLSIAILMMLYDFQFLFIVVQGFFISNKIWVTKYESLLLKVRTYFLINPLFK